MKEIEKITKKLKLKKQKLKIQELLKPETTNFKPKINDLKNKTAHFEEKNK